jgi:hypothetical protein
LEYLNRFTTSTNTTHRSFEHLELKPSLHPTMIPDAKIVSSTPYHRDDALKNTWLSPNAFPIPRPNPLKPDETINERRHPTWWDEKRPWMAYIPVFDLSGNANHEIFSISRVGILSQSPDYKWYVSKEKIAEWKAFFETIKQLCIHIRQRTRLYYSGTIVGEPEEADYEKLNGATEPTHGKLAEIIYPIHDRVREWIGYFNWLWVSRGSESDPRPYSPTLTTPAYSTFIKFLSRFSRTLRGVCIDFSVHPASELHINQWKRYNVPIYILLKHRGTVIREVPDYLSIQKLGSRLSIKKHPNHMKQFAIDQFPSNSSPSVMYMWEPPEQSHKGLLRKRQQYRGSFFHLDILNPHGSYRIFWYRQRITDPANMDLSMKEHKKKHRGHMLAMFEDDWVEEVDEDDGGYATSDESDHERYLTSKISILKVDPPTLPPPLETDDMNTVEASTSPFHQDIDSFVREPMNPDEDDRMDYTINDGMEVVHENRQEKEWPVDDHQRYYHDSRLGSYSDHRAFPSSSQMAPHSEYIREPPHSNYERSRHDSHHHGGMRRHFRPRSPVREYRSRSPRGMPDRRDNIRDRRPQRMESSDRGDNTRDRRPWRMEISHRDNIRDRWPRRTESSMRSRSQSPLPRVPRRLRR